MRHRRHRKYIAGFHKDQTLVLFYFCLYVKDLPNSLANSHAAMYADGINMTVRSSDVTHLEE